MTNQDISDTFRKISYILEIKGENPFRIRAYQRAAQNIDSLTDDLADVPLKELTNISGIGVDLAKKIQEITSTNSLKFYEELKKSIPEGLISMLDVPGLGPKKIKVIYEKLKIKTIDDLEKNAKEGRLRQIEGIRKKTESNILRGIGIFKKSRQRVPINIAMDVAKEFISQMKKINEIQRLEIAGSLRRKKETIEDIDILATSKNPLSVMDEFSKLDLVDEVLLKGESKTSVIAKTSGMQVDLRVLKDNSFGAGLLYFTGSKEFNIELRSLAAKKGYKINEYGVFSVSDDNKGRLLSGKNEKDIFSLLEMEYIQPELREARGEIKAGQEKNLPKLVEIADVNGDLHVHSEYSDGTNTIEEIALAAKEFGYEYVGITDHSQSLKIANGLSVDELYKKIEEVKRVDKKIKGIKVLCGTEVDILSDGKLDYPDKVLKELDFVIAAIHGGFNQTKQQQTKRIISACKNKYVNIIAHPTGFLWGSREAYELDFNEFFEAAKSENVALEINSHPFRLDLNDICTMKAKKAGVKICVNTDAHVTDYLNLIKFGINVARRGWLSKEDIVNCMKLDKLLSWIKR